MKDLNTVQEGKETWSKPELEMVSVKESTLNNTGFAGDNFIFS